MKTRSLCSIAVVLLTIAITSQSAVWTVDRQIGTRTVLQALEQAQPGDTVAINGGTHQVSNLEISKPVTVIGYNQPVLEAGGEGHVLIVTSSDVSISGLIIRGAPVSYVEDYAGILIEDAENCTIEKNRLESNFFAIYLARSSRCRIADNHIIGAAVSQAQSGNGIHLWYSRDIIISNNTVSNHRDGIYFEFVKHSHITGNTSKDNLRYGLHFMFSDTCTYESNSFIANGSGVAVMYTHFVKMIRNRFEKSWGSSSYGLLLKELTDSEVRENVFLDNSVGIYVEGCNRLAVEKNEFRDNGWAVRIMANAMDNRFERNNFMGNSFQVATDSRQNFSSFEGNFWSTYSGYDLDRDGQGDVPFRPVSLFSMIVQKNPPTLVLMHSLTIQLMDLAERVIPILTPVTLVDPKPSMEPIR